MLTIFFPLLLAVLGQSALDPLYGRIEEGVQTFRITLRDGRTISGAIRSKEQWVGGGDKLPRGKLEIWEDTPWSPKGKRDELYSSVELMPEARALRRERLEDGWKEAGYAFLDTLRGKRPFKQKDIDLANLAAQMAATVAGAAPPAPEDTQTTAPQAAQPAAQPAAPPGFLRSWGGHLGVIAAGTLLAALVLKMMVLKG